MRLSDCLQLGMTMLSMGKGTHGYWTRLGIKYHMRVRVRCQIQPTVVWICWFAHWFLNYIREFIYSSGNQMRGIKFYVLGNVSQVDIYTSALYSRPSAIPSCD